MPQPLQTGPRPSRVSTPRRSGGLLMHPSQVGEWRPPASAPACVVIPLCFFRAAPPALPPRSPHLRPLPPQRPTLLSSTLPRSTPLRRIPRRLPQILLFPNARSALSAKMLITTPSRGKIIAIFFATIPFYPIFALPKTRSPSCSGSDSVAQLVEQYTFNVWVLGSSPSGITISTLRCAFCF